jgi:TfoX/Sxy family transcriptional regulator of competence genes
MRIIIIHFYGKFIFCKFRILKHSYIINVVAHQPLLGKIATNGALVLGISGSAPLVAVTSGTHVVRQSYVTYQWQTT